MMTGHEPVSLPSALAWRGPAPPNATSAKSRGSKPCCTETRRSAPNMFSLTMSMMPAAAASTESRPVASAIVCTAVRAASGSRVTSPPASADGRWPSTTLASVTVGSVPPAEYAAGPGVAPADCGPTRRAWVSGGTCAMEPPPAPTVRTSTDVARTLRSPTVVSRPMRGVRSSTSATSVDVPPMSKVRKLRCPVWAATHAAPVTPPAGPDSSRLTGLSAATPAETSPPSLRRIESEPLTPESRSWPSRLAT